jgi:hypothetical protein
MMEQNEISVKLKEKIFDIIVSNMEYIDTFKDLVGSAEFTDDLLCSRWDEIDNAVFEAIKTVAHDPEDLEWDMSIIAPVTQCIEDTLHNKGIGTCHPWVDENQIICCYTDDRCPHCTKSVIPEHDMEDNDKKSKSTIKKHYSVTIDLKEDKNFTNDKKKNMAYWDTIDDYAFDCVSAIALMSETDIGVDCDFTDISKEVVDLITNRLKENFGGTFPYIDENY